MTEQKKGGLLTLCIFSWVFIGFQFLSQLIALSSGPMTDEQLREEKLNMLAGQTQEAIDMLGSLFDEMLAILEINRDNMYIINGLGLLITIIGGIGVFAMFKLRKIGFHLYIVYSILAIALPTYFFGGFKLGVAGILFTAFFAILFIILYSRHLKKMA